MGKGRGVEGEEKGWRSCIAEEGRMKERRDEGGGGDEEEG